MSHEQLTEKVNNLEKSDIRREGREAIRDGKIKAVQDDIEEIKESHETVKTWKIRVNTANILIRWGLITSVVLASIVQFGLWNTIKKIVGIE